MVILALGVPFKGARKVNAITLQALVEVCYLLNYFVIHMDFAISEPHHCSIHLMFDFPIFVSC
jgi:hypothetical protein